MTNCLPSKLKLIFWLNYVSFGNSHAAEKDRGNQKSPVSTEIWQEVIRSDTRHLNLTLLCARMMRHWIGWCWVYRHIALCYVELVDILYMSLDPEENRSTIDRFVTWGSMIQLFGSFPFSNEFWGHKWRGKRRTDNVSNRECSARFVYTHAFMKRTKVVWTMQFLSYFFRQSYIQSLKMCCHSYQNNAENTPTVAYTHSTQEDLVLVEIAAELCVQKSGTVYSVVRCC